MCRLVGRSEVAKGEHLRYLSGEMNAYEEVNCQKLNDWWYQYQSMSIELCTMKSNRTLMLNVPVSGRADGVPNKWRESNGNSRQSYCSIRSVSDSEHKRLHFNSFITQTQSQSQLLLSLVLDSRDIETLNLGIINDDRRIFWLLFWWQLLHLTIGSSSTSTSECHPEAFAFQTIWDVKWSLV